MQVPWTNKGIDPGGAHKEHIDRLIDHFFHNTKALVDRNMAHYDQLASDELYHEVVQHWTMVKNRCQSFVGRDVSTHQCLNLNPHNEIK